MTMYIVIIHRRDPTIYIFIFQRNDAAKSMLFVKLINQLVSSKTHLFLFHSVKISFVFLQWKNRICGKISFGEQIENIETHPANYFQPTLVETEKEASSKDVEKYDDGCP